MAARRAGKSALLPDRAAGRWERPFYSVEPRRITWYPSTWRC